jgi:tetratricopeptide (TPR) repeat protein
MKVEGIAPHSADLAFTGYDLIVMRPKSKVSALLLSSLIAIPSLSQAVSSQKAQIALHLQQAQQDLRDRRPELAVQEFKAVVALDPNNADARGNLGVLLFFRADYSNAVPQLRAALKLKPDLWRIQSLLGLAERRLGDDSAGRADLEASFPHLDEAKIKIDVGRDLIDSYSASGDLDKAATVASALLKVEPTDPGLLYTAYRIYSDLAGEAMLDLSIAAPESGQMHQAMAHELYRERDLPGAIANFRKAIAADPNLPGAHFELAEALHASADPKLRQEAEQEYKLAVAANSDDVKAISRLGDLTFDKNDLDGATNYYKRALALAPNDADASIGLAHVYTEKGAPQSAEPLLQTVIAADPTNVLAHYRLSSVYRAMNQPADAKHQIEEYQKYKDIKEKMRTIYKEMRLDSPQDEVEK